MRNTSSWMRALGVLALLPACVTSPATGEPSSEVESVIGTCNCLVRYSLCTQNLGGDPSCACERDYAACNRRCGRPPEPSQCPPACDATTSTAAWNPSAYSPLVTLSNNNRTATSLVQQRRGSVRANAGRSAGRWYWEIQIEPRPAGLSRNDPMVGVGSANVPLTGRYVGEVAESWSYYPRTGYKYNNSSAGVWGPYGAVGGPGDVVGVAMNLDAHSLEFFLNGVSQGVAFTNLPTGTVLYPMVGTADATFIATARFAPPFAFPPPAGYSAFGCP